MNKLDAIAARVDACTARFDRFTKRRADASYTRGHSEDLSPGRVIASKKGSSGGTITLSEKKDLNVVARGGTKGTVRNRWVVKQSGGASTYFNNEKDAREFFEHVTD